VKSRRFYEHEESKDGRLELRLTGDKRQRYSFGRRAKKRTKGAFSTDLTLLIGDGDADIVVGQLLGRPLVDSTVVGRRRRPCTGWRPSSIRTCSRWLIGGVLNHFK
jgi:hypothetical protein